MAATGTRGSQPVSPANRTGKVFQQQLREKKARDEARGIDISEVRRQARTEGFDAGYDMGFAAGWDALAAYLADEGILVPDDAEPDDAEDHK